MSLLLPPTGIRTPQAHVFYRSMDNLHQRTATLDESEEAIIQLSIICIKEVVFI